MKTRSDKIKVKRLTQSAGNKIDRIKSFNRISMDLAAVLGDFLQEKNKMTQKQLSEIFGKKESEISKWLSGKHNFTIKSIALIEEKLEKQLIFSKYDNPNQPVAIFDLQSELDSLSKFVFIQSDVKKPEINVFGPAGNTIWLDNSSLCVSSNPDEHKTAKHKTHSSGFICSSIQNVLLDEKELQQFMIN